MKKAAILLTASIALLAAGCTSTATTAGAAGTNVVTTVKTLDPAAVAAIDGIVQSIISAAPAAINDAQAISALVHGTNAPAAK